MDGIRFGFVVGSFIASFRLILLLFFQKIWIYVIIHKNFYIIAETLKNLFIAIVNVVFTVDKKLKGNLLMIKSFKTKVKEVMIFKTKN